MLDVCPEVLCSGLVSGEDFVQKCPIDRLRLDARK
jgi:hypothetical protein